MLARVGRPTGWIWIWAVGRPRVQRGLRSKSKKKAYVHLFLLFSKKNYSFCGKKINVGFILSLHQLQCGAQGTDFFSRTLVLSLSLSSHSSFKQYDATPASKGRIGSDSPDNGVGSPAFMLEYIRTRSGSRRGARVPVRTFRQNHVIICQ